MKWTGRESARPPRKSRAPQEPTVEFITSHGGAQEAIRNGHIVFINATGEVGVVVQMYRGRIALVQTDAELYLLRLNQIERYDTHEVLLEKCHGRRS